MQIIAAVGNAMLDTLLDDFDSGGSILFHTSGDSEVADCALNSDAFAAASGGSASMNTGSAVEDTNTTAGTIAHAHLVTSGSTIETQLTCGVGSGELQFSSLTFGDGETLTVSSLTVSMTTAALT